MNRPPDRPQAAVATTSLAQITMSPRISASCLQPLLAAALLVCLTPLSAAEGDSAPPAAPQPTPAESLRSLRETNRNASPAVSPKAFEEWRKKNPEAAARMDRARNMTPEERQAAAKEWHAKNPAIAPAQPQTDTLGPRKLGAPAREERLKLLQVRFTERAADLEKKQAEGALTESEKNELARLRSFIKQQEALPPKPKPPAPTAPPARPNP